MMGWVYFQTPGAHVSVRSVTEGRYPLWRRKGPLGSGPFRERYLLLLGMGWVYFDPRADIGV